MDAFSSWAVHKGWRSPQPRFGHHDLLYLGVQREAKGGRLTEIRTPRESPWLRQVLTLDFLDFALGTPARGVELHAVLGRHRESAELAVQAPIDRGIHVRCGPDAELDLV